MSPSLFLLAIDALVPLVVLVVIGFLIRSVVNGDFRTDPNHRYAEHQVHLYAVVGQWNNYRDDNGRGDFHEACANEYLKEMLEDDPYFEVYPIEKNINEQCSWCECQ